MCSPSSAVAAKRLYKRGSRRNLFAGGTNGLRVLLAAGAGLRAAPPRLGRRLGGRLRLGDALAGALALARRSRRGGRDRRLGGHVGQELGDLPLPERGLDVAALALRLQILERPLTVLVGLKYGGDAVDLGLDLLGRDLDALAL